MSNLARQELYFDQFMTLDDMLNNIENVNREDVQKIAQQFFTTENIALAMLGRLGDLKVEREDLTC
jgi:predicted Zn-dependent peptidase